MRVSELMTGTPSACDIEDFALDAARIMWKRDCGAVPVIDHDRRIAGIVTDRDICMAALFQGLPLSTIPLVSIMSRDVCTCEAGDDVKDAERLMQERQIRRLPVVADGGSLIGMLSLCDVAQGVKRVSQARAASVEGEQLLRTVTAISEPRRTAHVTP